MKSIMEIYDLIDSIESSLKDIDIRYCDEYDLTAESYAELDRLREAVSNLSHDIEGDTDLVL